MSLFFVNFNGHVLFNLPVLFSVQVTLEAGTTGLSGMLRLSFNGETTAAFSVLSTATDITSALQALSTVGVVTVSTAQSVSGRSLEALQIQVEFTRVGGTYPQSYGAMPPLSVTTSALGGLAASSVSHVCVGGFRTGYVCDEQSVTVSRTASGNATFCLALHASGDFAGAVGDQPFKT